jgi:hypothetical protein
VRTEADEQIPHHSESDRTGVKPGPSFVWGQGCRIFKSHFTQFSPTDTSYKIIPFGVCDLDRVLIFTNGDTLVGNNRYRRQRVTLILSMFFTFRKNDTRC